MFLKKNLIPMNILLTNTLTNMIKYCRSEYVFSSKIDKPYGEVKRSFATALKKAKISDFEFHDCRHTFASHLVMKGVKKSIRFSFKT